MERFNFHLFFIVLVLFPIYSFAQEYPNPVVDSLMKDGINEIITQNYDQAKENFTLLNKKFPSLPFGNIYLAATEIAKSYDYGEKYNTDYIKNKLEQAKEDAESLLKKNDKDIWNHYFVALAEGYTAYFDALNKNWFSSLNNGLSAIKIFEKCLNMNPKFYDAYTAVGSFKYWKSRKTEFLNWLPFVKNEEKKGINYLLIAVNHYSYNKYLAFNSLMWIYIDKKEYGKAITLAQKVLDKYPESRSFKWSLARAYEGVNLDKSIALYKQLLNTYHQLPGSNKLKEIILMHIIAQQYYKLGNDKKALQLCNEILAENNLSPYVLDKLSSRLKRVRKLKKELSK